ncbi:hypothetical protein D0T60_05325 [Bacteroides sp. 224]|nr:hypothetical protein [Bacteroides sp. 224]
MNNSKYIILGIVRNGWKIAMVKMSESGAYYNEYPPAPRFDKVVKLFYPNGNLKYTGKLVGEHLPIGESIYYDEEGKIINRVDEDTKFGKFKLDDILKFIENEGWINLETGEGREDVTILEDGRCDKIISRFSISERVTTDGIAYWFIVIRAMSYNNFMKTTYHLDKNSGEVLYRHSEKVVYKK